MTTLTGRSELVLIKCVRAKTFRAYAAAAGLALLACLLAFSTIPSAKDRAAVAQPGEVANGAIILLKDGCTNAAIVIENQSADPETVDYTWYLRSDGGTTFETNNPKVMTGGVKGAGSVSFGSFNVEWSTAGNNTGWIYYPSRHRSLKLWGSYWSFDSPDGALIAVTTERDITKVDAKDTRWKFMRGQ